MISEKLALDLVLISKQLEELEKVKLTGKVTFTMNLSQGRINTISLLVDKNLKNHKKTIEN